MNFIRCIVWRMLIWDPATSNTKALVADLPNNISMEFDKGNYVVEIILDMSKACFHSVDCQKVLTFLEEMSIRGITKKLTKTFPNFTDLHIFRVYRCNQRQKINEQGSPTGIDFVVDTLLFRGRI